MAVQILDDYPPGTARGNTCYACGAGRRELRDADGALRSERVVDFMQLIDFEGHMMLCEQCVAEAARLLGMVEPIDAARDAERLAAATERCDQLATELAEARDLVHAIRQYNERDPFFEAGTTPNADVASPVPDRDAILWHGMEWVPAAALEAAVNRAPKPRAKAKASA
jgi:hypothetical protein